MAISNTVIVNNFSDWFGGGLLNYDTAPLTLRNCTIAFNCVQHAYANVATVSSMGGTPGTANAFAYNTIITNGFCSDGSVGHSTITNLDHCYVSSTTDPAEHTVNNVGYKSVFFTNAAGDSQYGYATWADDAWRALDWDYSIVVDSPAVNAGADENALATDGSVLAADVAGARRFVGIVDIGAYENQDVVPTEPLAAPANVTVISAGANRKLVSWDAVENAVGYTVAYSADQVSWTEIAASDTFVTVTGLAYGNQVAFKVKALGDGSSYSDSEFSESVTKYVCPMDIDSDGRIGPADRSTLSSAWFTRSSSAAWDLRADIDADGFVGPVDRNFLSLNWMKSAASESLVYPEAKADAVFEEIADDGEIDFCVPTLDVDFDLF